MVAVALLLFVTSFVGVGAGGVLGREAWDEGMVTEEELMLKEGGFVVEFLFWLLYCTPVKFWSESFMLFGVSWS